MGGVLEHPATSKLFSGILPRPGVTDGVGGYSICIDQSWFGFAARKTTLLYIVGIDQSELPEIPYSLDAIRMVVTTSRKRNRKADGGTRIMPKSMRDETVPLLAEWLVEVAERIERKKPILNT